jgi:hypothetical protein
MGTTAPDGMPALPIDRVLPAVVVSLQASIPIMSGRSRAMERMAEVMRLGLPIDQ